jgi:phosphoenolpyruvate-protein kinase (PTS system EI component)
VAVAAGKALSIGLFRRAFLYMDQGNPDAKVPHTTGNLNRHDAQGVA